MSKYRISALFLVTSVLLFAAAALVGSHINAQGMLIEPAFFCIPLGYVSALLSLLTAIYVFTKGKLSKIKQS